MRHLIRFATVVFSLMLASLYMPGFMIYQFQTSLLIGLVVALLGWMVESLINGEISPFVRGIIGALLCAGTLLIFSMTNQVTLSLLGVGFTSILTGTVDLFQRSYARFTE